MLAFIKMAVILLAMDERSLEASCYSTECSETLKVHFESTIYVALRRADFSQGLKRITASKLSLRMRDRNYRESKANRILI